MGNYHQIKYFDKMQTVGLLLFILMNMPLVLKAQLVQIKIDVPASIGVEGIETLQLIPQPTLQKGEETNLVMMTFSIYASENIRPLVKVCSSGANNEEGDIEVKWAWQNNGKLSPPANINLICSPVSFPLSNSGTLIDKIKGQPEVLNAKLFIAVQSSKQTGDVGYYENIEIKIEYN